MAVVAGHVRCSRLSKSFHPATQPSESWLLSQRWVFLGAEVNNSNLVDGPICQDISKEIVSFVSGDCEGHITQGFYTNYFK